MNSNETYEIDKCGGLTLIIGGAYQGKLTYAVQRLGFNAAAVLDLAAAQFPEANVFDSVIGGNSAVHIVRKKRTALIAREIGCGVVPLSEEDRLWRELHGAALAKAAAKADSVIRLFCGLPERLK